MSREGCDGLFHTFRGPIRDGDSCVCGKTNYPPAPEPVSRAGDGTNDPAYEAAIALLDRVLDMGVARWHHSSPDDDSTIHEWLGLSADEYAAWAEGNANTLVALASPEART